MRRSRADVVHLLRVLTAVSPIAAAAAAADAVAKPRFTMKTNAAALRLSQHTRTQGEISRDLKQAVQLRQNTKFCEMKRIPVDLVVNITLCTVTVYRHRLTLYACPRI